MFLNYSLKVFETERRTSSLCGVSMAPRHQHRGHFARLINHSLTFQWYSWERLLTGHDGDLEHVGAFILGWIVYVLLAVSMVGLCAALVYFLAPSAAGELILTSRPC